MARSCSTVGRHTGDVELGQRPLGPVDRRLERARGTRLADHLGQQGIELRRRRQPEIAAGIDPHTRTGGLAIGGERAGALRHDPRLDREPARVSDGLLVGDADRREGVAGGDPELRLDEVQSQDLLGDRVLDLDAWIAFDEEVPAALGVDQELHRAGILVSGGAREGHGIGEDALAQRVVEVGRGRHLDHLLVAQLDRAVALEEVHDVALAVAQDLDLDVARPRHDLLEEDRVVAEGRLGFALAARERLVHLARRRHDAHAAPAAAGRRLQHHRIADRLRDSPWPSALEASAPGAPGTTGMPCFSAKARACDLVAEQREGGGRGTDEAQALGPAALGEFGILREEAVAGMDAVGAALLGRRDDRLDVEIGAQRIGDVLADLAGLVRQLRMQRLRIRRREHGDRFDPERRRRPGDANGDLAAVGDQHAFEHRRFPSSFFAGLECQLSRVEHKRA